MSLKLSAFSLTDAGRRRERNEDDLLVDEPLAVYAVADGMGGHQGGEHASRLALEVLRREIEASLWSEPEPAGPAQELQASVAFLDTAEIPAVSPGGGSGTRPDSARRLLHQAAQRASDAVFDAARRDPKLRGMGTTLTAMLVEGGRAYFAHAGDSRAYRLREGRIEQVTDDHSWTAEQVKAGMMTEEEAKSSAFRHVITRSIGFERSARLDLQELEVQEGDAFLLCSDGMSNYVDAAELSEVMGSTPAAELPRRLVDLANERGGDDNVTVVVVTVEQGEAARP